MMVTLAHGMQVFGIVHPGLRIKPWNRQQRRRRSWAAVLPDAHAPNLSAPLDVCLDVDIGIGVILCRRFRLGPARAGGYVVREHAEKTEQGKAPSTGLNSHFHTV
jgi:hypothetical protein